MRSPTTAAACTWWREATSAASPTGRPTAHACSRSVGCSTSSSPNWVRATHGGNKDPESGVLAGLGVLSRPLTGWRPQPGMGSLVEQGSQLPLLPKPSQSSRRLGPGPREGARERDAGRVFSPATGPHPGGGPRCWGCGGKEYRDGGVSCACCCRLFLTLNFPLTLASDFVLVSLGT